MPNNAIDRRRHISLLSSADDGPADGINLGRRAAQHILEHGRTVSCRTPRHLFGGAFRSLERQTHPLRSRHRGRLARQFAHQEARRWPLEQFAVGHAQQCRQRVDGCIDYQFAPDKRTSVFHHVDREAGRPQIRLQRAETRVRLDRNRPLAAQPRQAGSEQGRAEGGHALGDARRAEGVALSLSKGRDENLAVAQAVLQGQRQAVFSQANGQLSCRAFRLPTLDQHQREARAATFSRIVRSADRGCAFHSIRPHQPRPAFAQRRQSFLPGAEHGHVHASR